MTRKLFDFFFSKISKIPQGRDRFRPFWPKDPKYDTPVVYNTITAFLLSHFIIIQKIIENGQAVLEIFNFEKSSDVIGRERLAQKRGEGIFF